MGESILKYEEKMWNLVNISREKMPEHTKATEMSKEAAYSDGALDKKTKKLMALAVAIQAGCRDCMITQTTRALDLGATADEIFETCAVAISMGGTLAWSKSLVVVDYLKERGLI